MGDRITYSRPNSGFEIIDIPAGVYEATCVKHYPRPKTFMDEPAKPGIVFKYVIDLGPEEGARELSRHIAIAVSSRSTLRKDMVAIHGEEAWQRALLNDGLFTELMDATIDQPVLLNIESRISKQGKPYSVIAGVLPPKRIQPTTTIVKRPIREKLMPAMDPVPSKTGAIHYSVIGVAPGIAGHVTTFLAEQGATYDSTLKVWISPTRYEKLKDYEVGVMSAKQVAEVEVSKNAGPIKQTPADLDEIPF